MARKRSLPASWFMLFGMPASALILFLLGKLFAAH